ncbi:MAG: DUF748 domain-containing protein [Desulfobacteraceae bacterium]
MKIFSKYRQLNRLVKTGIWLAVFIVFYTVSGFFILPAILHKVSVDQLSKVLQREVSITKVSFNPYSLFLAVQGVTIKEKNQNTDFFSIDHARVNIRAASILKFCPIISEVAVDGFYLNLVRQTEDIYNFSDLLNQDPEKKDKEEQEKEADTQPAFFSVSNIVLTHGKVRFHDIPADKMHSLTDIHLGIPEISNFVTRTDIFVTPEFSLKVNGSPLALNGKTKPFIPSLSSVMDLSIKKIDLTDYFEYLPFKPNFTLENGILDLSCSLDFKRHPDQTALPALSLSGNIDLYDLEIFDINQDAVFKMDRLSFLLGPSPVLEKKVNIKSIMIGSPVVSLVKNPSQPLNIYTLMPETSQVEQTKDVNQPEQTTDRNQAEKTAGTYHAQKENAPDQAETSAGTLQAETDVEKPQADDNPQPLDFTLNCKRIDVKNSLVTLKEDGNVRPLFSLESFALENLGIESQTKTINVETIKFHNSSLAVFRLKDQCFNFQAFTPQAPVPETSNTPSGSGPAGQGKADTKAETNDTLPWNVSVREVSLQGGDVSAQDLVSMGKGNIQAGDINFNARGISTGSGETTDIQLGLVLNKNCTIQVTGRAGITPVKADLKLVIDNLELFKYQPFIAQYANVILSRGSLNAAVNIAVSESEGQPVNASFSGDVSLSEFLCLESHRTEEIVKFDTLDLKGIEVDLFPLKTAVNTIALNKPVSNLAIYADGQINFSRLVKSSAEPSKETEPPPAGKKPGEQLFPIDINKIVIQKGSFVFEDRSITPHFKTRLTDIDLEIKELSSHKKITPDFNLSALVNTSTPVQVKGKINPLQTDLFCDMTVSCSNMDLGYLTPYAGKYAGYKIQKGKITLDLDYFIKNHTLEAKNDLFLDQFSFGEKVDSSDAVNAPVKLAVALLKDPKGRIVLNIPVRGNLDDPEFSVAGIVLSTIKNLLIKAATSPFTLLSSMFGGGEDLNIISFDPGSSQIPASGFKKIETLKKALSQRPELNLEIRGYIDSDQDRAALVHSAFEKRLKSEKIKALAEKGDAEVLMETIQLTDEEYTLFIKKAFEKTQKADALTAEKASENTAAGSEDKKSSDADSENKQEKDVQGISQKQMVQAIKEEIVVTTDDLSHLASARAFAVKKALLADGAVAPGRIFIVEAEDQEIRKQKNAIDSGSVILSLK